MGWLKRIVSFIETWWGYMSGALSVPFALLALLNVSPRLLFASLAYVALWGLVISLIRRLNALQDRMKPILEITYDENRDCKTLLEPPRSSFPLVYLRLIVSIQSISEITGCQGHLVQIDHAGTKVWSGVNLLLSFAPAEDSDATFKTIRAGNTYHLDVAIIRENGDVVVETATRTWPAHFRPLKEIFAEKGDYFLTISVAGSSTVPIVPTVKRVRLYLADNYRDCALEVL